MHQNVTTHSIFLSFEAFFTLHSRREVFTMKGASSGFVLLVLLTYRADPVKSDKIMKVQWLSLAINDVLREFPTRVDLIYFGKSHGPSEYLVQNILRGSNASKMVEVSNGNTRLNVSSILIFDSVQNFKNICKDIKWLSNPKVRHRHLVYAPNVSVSDVSESIKDGFDIDNVGFLMNETETSIELVSSFMFTEKKCKANQLKTINRFSVKRTMQWKKSIFYPKKYQDFHSCSLSVCYDQRIGLKAIERTIIHQLSDFYNFKIVIKAFDAMNKTAAIAGNCDLVMLQIPNTRDTRYIVSVTLESQNLKFVVPPGNPYSTFEKMFMMFDIQLWIAIIATLFACCGTIQVVNLMSPKVQDFVFGSKIQTPTLNLFNTFLCGGQNKTPGRNFARFVLMLFILWSLIIRTCYQSNLYEFLQKDLREATIQSIEELYEKNFTYFQGIGSVPSMLDQGRRLNIVNSFAFDYTNSQLSFSVVWRLNRVKWPT
jgi:hypothetical protein